MRPYDSTHLLPLNSIFFSSTPHLHAASAPNPTLVNLQDAASTSITALPAAPKSPVRKPSLWRRVRDKLRKVLCGKKDVEMRSPQQVRLAAVEEEGEGEWEDVEDAWGDTK
jgi:hypothetical protein